MSSVTYNGGAPSGSGSSIIADGGNNGNSGVAVEESGEPIAASQTILNFIGPTVTTVGKKANITVSGGSIAFPISLLGLGPRQDQYGAGHNMDVGTINPLEDPALGTFTVITVKGADNQATRITGIDATGIAVNTVVLFMNLSDSGTDCGQVIFNHLDDSTADTNQILCPQNVDYMLPIFGGVFVIYGSDFKWHPISENGQHQTISCQNLRLYPNALMPIISGVVNDWNPVAESSYAVGEGLAGGNCTFETYSYIRVQTDADGATLTGLAPNNGTNGNPYTLGGVKILVNLGPGTLVLSPLDSRSSGTHQFNTPNTLPIALGPGECAWVISPLGDPDPNAQWQAIALSKSQAMVQITPALALAGLIDNWNPTDGTSGLSYLYAGWIQIAGGLAGALNSMNSGITGMRIVITNYGSAIAINHNESGGSGGVTTGKPFYCPGGTTFTLPEFGSVAIAYQSVNDVWIVGV